MELAFSMKHELVEELKVSFKSNNLSKEEQKTQIKELQTKMDDKRKNGVKVIKQKV